MILVLIIMLLRFLIYWTFTSIWLKKWNELCLGNIWKDWSVDDMKKTGLKGCVYDFGINYDAIEVSNILGIHKHLIKKMK